MNEIRWNPLVKWWIIVAEHRSVRPWRPEEKEVEFKCPFCPGAPELVHLDRWDVVSLPNKYPALSSTPLEVHRESFEPYRVREAKGSCRVIIETPEHEGDLYTLTLEHATRVMEVFREEYLKLSQLDYVEYVAIFRNKGKEIGVSLTHPHSQIYALPFTPLRILVEIGSMREYQSRYEKCLLCDIVKYELSRSIRVIYENRDYIALLPYYAMWPYEIHVYPKKHLNSLGDLDHEGLKYLADALRVITALYTELLERDAPYIMVFHNPPTRGDHSYYHFHVEFYQPYRDKEKLKYAAGIEWGFWVFTYDGSPEKKVLELKNACEKVESRLRGVLGECK